MKLFIDTSIFVDVLIIKQVKSSKSLFKSLQEENKGFTSAIIVAELSMRAYRSPRKDALEKTLKLLSLVNIVNLSRETAIEGGRIYAELIKKGKEIELNDYLITATSLSLGIHEIVTKDIDHFNRIENIKALTPEELDIPLCHISTDYVFDEVKGYYIEEDRTNPINYYGYTKKEGERILNELNFDLPFYYICLFYYTLNSILMILINYNLQFLNIYNKKIIFRNIYFFITKKRKI